MALTVTTRDPRSVRIRRRWDNESIIDLEIHSPNGSWITVAYDVNPSTIEEAFGFTGPFDEGVLARLLEV